MHDNFNRNNVGVNSTITRKESSLNTEKNQKREYRKLNQFKAVDEISNDNMFKNNNYYSINNRIEFDEKAEENFRTFFHFCYSKGGVKIMLTVLYMRLLSSKINIFKDLFKLSKIIHIENIFHIISFIASIYFASENYLKNQLINIIIFITFTLNHCIYVLLVLYKINDNYCHFISVPSELIFDFSLAFFLDIPHKLVLFSFCLVSLVMIISEKDLIGFPLFYFIFGTIFSLSLYFLYNIIIREIWALFDSFKRSYCNIKQCILENNLNPNFIVSLKIVTYERNQAANNYGNFILGKKNNKTELLNLIHPNLKELFIKLVEETSSNENNRVSFFFPFCKLDNKDNNFNEPNINGMFSFDYLKFRWKIVLVCRTIWKLKPAIWICLFPTEDIISNEIFSKYSEKFNNLLEQVIYNNDIICSEIAKIYAARENNGLKKSRNNVKKRTLSKKKLRYFSGYSKYNTSKKLLQRPTIEIPNSEPKEFFKTMLFFCKSQIELLYDISLTIEYYFYKVTKDTFFHYNLTKGLREKLESIDLNIIKNYYYDFFCDIFRANNCTIDYDIQNKNSNKILIEANYLRILIFNATFFMERCLNKNNSIKQGLQISIKVLKKNKEKTRCQSSYSLNENYFFQNENNVEGNLEFNFILFSGDPNIDLGQISKVLSKKKDIKIYPLKNELIQAKYLGIGLLTIYHLLNDFYKTDLELTTLKNDDGLVDHSLKFKISCKLEDDGILNIKSVTPNLSCKNKKIHSISSSKQLEKFFKPKNYFSQSSYYNEIFKKLYSHVISLMGDNDVVKTQKTPYSPTPKANTKKMIEIPKKMISSKFSFKDFITEYNKEREVSPSSKKSESNESLDNEKLKIKVLIINSSPECSKLSKYLIEDSNGKYFVEIAENVKDLENIIKNDTKYEKTNYKNLIVGLINMNSNQEIEFVEKIDKENEAIIIYGYFFGKKINLKVKSNVKFEQKFDLSLGYENVTVALNELYINKCIPNK